MDKKLILEILEDNKYLLGKDFVEAIETLINGEKNDK